VGCSDSFLLTITIVGLPMTTADYDAGYVFGATSPSMVSLDDCPSSTPLYFASPSNGGGTSVTSLVVIGGSNCRDDECVRYTKNRDPSLESCYMIWCILCPQCVDKTI
jgi:hypothetical protein